MRFFMYAMGDGSVPAPPPTPELMAEMGTFLAEATKEGWLIATGAMAPSAQETRVRRTDGAFTVTDGPFAEAKELVGGWALVEMPSKNDAIAAAKRFLSIAGDGETHIRQVFGPEDAEPTP